MIPGIVCRKIVLCRYHGSNCSPSDHTFQDPVQDLLPAGILLWVFHPTLIIHSIVELRIHICFISLLCCLIICNLVTSLVLLSYVNFELQFKSSSEYVISIIICCNQLKRASLVAQQQRIHLPMQETWVWSLGQEDALEEEMTTHSRILAWKIPWTEEPAGLQSGGS